MGGSQGQPQPQMCVDPQGWGQGRLGHRPAGDDGSVGSMAWYRAVGSCSSGRGKAGASVGSSSPGQGLALQCLGASPEGLHGEGAAFGCTSSELALRPGSQTSGSPQGCSHNPYSRAQHHAFLNSYCTNAVFVLWPEDNSTETLQYPHPSLWGEPDFPATAGSVPMSVLSKLTMPGAVC